MPVGSIAFYDSSGCPEGWSPYAPGRGRAILPAGPGFTLGAQIGMPLAPGDSPSHSHPFEILVRLPSQDYERIGTPGKFFLDGGNARATGTTELASANIPILKLILCQKTSAPADGQVPVGLTAFFDQAPCPQGWSQSKTTTGRFLVGLPADAERAEFGSKSPLADLEDRGHGHNLGGRLHLRGESIHRTCQYCGVNDIYGVANNGDTSFDGEASSTSSGLPFIQLLQCEKEAPDASEIRSIVHAVTFAAQAAAPGQLVTLYGEAMADDESHFAQIDPPGYLAKELVGVSVTFDEFPAALFFVRQDQINAQVPYGVAGRDRVLVRVIRDGIASEGFELSITEAAPELFAHQDDPERVIAIHPDSSLNSAGNPAREGDIVVLYATGEGRTTPPGTDAKLAVEPFPAPLLDHAVWIGGVRSETIYAAAAPGFAALLQLNVRIPRVSGRVPIQLEVGGNRSWSGVSIFVE
jgi:uncharacterized protein (TIGR03437 family)